MQYFIIRLVINALALWIADIIIPGIRFGGGESISIIDVFLVALIFGIVNAVIKPILALITCPFYILTLGLFTFVVNALMLMLTDWLVGPRFVVDGFWPAFWGSIIISIVSAVLSASLNENKQNREDYSSFSE